jgi:hypothetical protein
MSRGLIKLDFPSVTMNEEEPEPIVESVPITLGAKDLLSEDEEEKKENSEIEKGEEGEGGGDGEAEAEAVVEKTIQVEKIVGKKVEIPSTPTPVMSATYNILAGPWTRDSKSGAPSWGLGAEVSALRAGLAESCAERER